MPSIIRPWSPYAVGRSAPQAAAPRAAPSQPPPSVQQAARAPVTGQPSALYGGDYLGEPISLTAGSIVKANSTAAVNTRALRNPTGAPMEIHEIRFEAAIDDTSTSAGERMVEYITPGVMGVDLSLGSMPLTNGFVPAWLLGRGTHLREEGGVGSNGKRVLHTWRLSRPMYVPAGGVVTPTLQHRGGITQPLDMRITLSGRSLVGQRKPTRSFLPYATSYVSKTFDANSLRDTDESRELDLVNPSSEPLMVERFTGRLLVSTRYTATGYSPKTWTLGERCLSDTTKIYECTDPGTGPSTSAPTGYGSGISCGNGVYFTYIGQTPGVTSTETDFPDFGNSLVYLRMLSSTGHPAVRNWTLFRNVFPPHTRSWETQHLLGPKNFYKVFLAKNLPAGQFDVLNTYGYLKVQAHIGMVGWREVKL